MPSMRHLKPHRVFGHDLCHPLIMQSRNSLLKRRCDMIATRYQMPLTVEFVKWLVLIGGAVALVAALATAVAAVEPMAEPARLPDDMGLLAKPMEVQPIKPFFPEEAPGVNMPPDLAVATLWVTLEAQRAGRVAEAVDGWRTIRLPAETEVW